MKQIISRGQKFAAEFLGTFLFSLFGTVVSQPAVYNGLILSMMCYLFADVSGAHVNPAVSTTFFILGHIDPIQMLLYVMAQFAGAFAGVALAKEMMPSDLSPCPVATLANAYVFGWETLCTFMFASTIMAVVWYKNHKPGYGGLGPLVIGASLATNLHIAIPFTGGSLNPARYLAVNTIFPCSYNITYIYILGQITGAVIASAMVAAIFGVSKDPWYCVCMDKAVVVTHTPPATTPIRSNDNVRLDV